MNSSSCGSTQVFFWQRLHEDEHIDRWDFDAIEFLLEYMQDLDDEIEAAKIEYILHHANASTWFAVQWVENLRFEKRTWGFAPEFPLSLLQQTSERFSST